MVAPSKTSSLSALYVSIAPKCFFQPSFQSCVVRWHDHCITLKKKKNRQNQKGKKTKAEVAKPNDLLVAKKHKSMDSDEDDEELQNEPGTFFYLSTFCTSAILDQQPVHRVQLPAPILMTKTVTKAKVRTLEGQCFTQISIS